MRKIGILFIIPILTYMLGDGLIKSVLESTDFLAIITSNKTKITTGSALFCFSVYKSKLILRFLSNWSFIGYILLLTGALLEFFGFEYGVLLSISGGLFEIFQSRRLVLEGFNSIDTVSIGSDL